MKNTQAYICTQCQYSTPKWQGKCPGCQEWNTLEKSIPNSAQANTNIKVNRPIQQISQVQFSDQEKMLSGWSEWDNVLGGGILPGAFLIIAGEPGIGKSTLLLKIADLISQHHKVIYFCTEESLSQVKEKMLRMNCEQSAVFFSDQPYIEQIEAIIVQEKPNLVIIDSIQNCITEENKLTSGSSLQMLKELTQRLMHIAKQNNVAIVLTGHITKDGIIAGPKSLEHLVDGVFYLQNEDRWSHKILHAVKNRFGPIEEIGFFQMQDNGITPVGDINTKLLEETNFATPGAVLSMSQQGSRFLLIEIQALCISSKFAMPQRVISGIDPKRVLIVAAILEKYLKIKFSEVDIFFKISGINKINDSYHDLAIALALISNYLKFALPANTVVIGEINLNGIIKTPKALQRMLKNLDRLNLNKIICGQLDSLPNLANLQTLTTVYELISLVPEKTGS